MERPVNLQKHNLLTNIQFCKLFETPTRMKIFFLFFLYSRLSLGQISSLLHITKSAVSYQLKKFIELGIVIKSKQPVLGSIMENYYELVPDFEKKEFGLDSLVEIPSNNSKELEILQIQVIKESFKWVCNIFSNFADFYNELEKNARNISEPFGMHFPKLYLQILPLSKKGYQYYLREIQKMTQGILKLIEEENKNGTVERPMMLLSTMLPIKDLLAYKDFV
ncbi:MAG: winged helix-turn-helix domain-containing protein [Promethearchaeota archaeon]